MSAIAEARRDIAATVNAALTARGLGDMRCDDYPPAQVVTPTLWVDMPQVQPARSGNVPITVARFPLVAAFDGADIAQYIAMDEVTALVWDALHDLDGVRVDSVEMVPLDVGGPSTKSLVFTVTYSLGADTLCRDTGALLGVTTP